MSVILTDSPEQSTDSALIEGGVRLDYATESALNELIARKSRFGGGPPLYKLSWAANDSIGLHRSHKASCPRTDPADWTCGCPFKNPLEVPLCFHENQLSYHLLSAVRGKELGYECLFHFIDNRTGKPLNPTASIIETVLPAILAGREMEMAIYHGARATYMRLRKQRQEAEEDQRKKQRFVEHGRDVEFLKASMLDLRPKSFGGGKGRTGADLVPGEVEEFVKNREA
jgi:hypothetical protein